MLGPGWRIGRIAGIDLRIDASWFIIVFLIAFTMYVRLDFLYDDPLALTIGSAVVLTVLFFGSVLAHELAHALVARGQGIRVRGITLFVFGGATQAKLEGRTPGAEALVTIVGPATSFALAAAFWGLHTLVDGVAVATIAGGIGFLAWINLALGAFNLVPGLPLDGGRLLRSLIWRVSGDLDKATRVASWVGRGFGWFLAGLGVLGLFLGGVPGGLWFIAIGWFLAMAARASYADLELRQFLADLDAEDVMSPHVITISDSLSVADAVRDYFLRSDHAAFPVVDEHDTVAGLLTLRDVRAVDADARELTTVRDAMTPLDEIVTASPDTDMDYVMGELEQNGARSAEANRALVIDAGGLQGIISPSDITRRLHRRQLLQSPAATLVRDRAGDSLLPRS